VEPKVEPNGPGLNLAIELILQGTHQLENSSSRASKTSSENLPKSKTLKVAAAANCDELGWGDANSDAGLREGYQDLCGVKEPREIGTVGNWSGTGKGLFKS